MAACFYKHYTRRKSKSQERSHHKSMVHFFAHCRRSAILRDSVHLARPNPRKGCDKRAELGKTRRAAAMGYT
mgnify:CR=1 FL=1